MNLLKETTEFVVHDSPNESVCDFDPAHVWFCDLDDDQLLDPTDRSLLSASELSRADRLRSILAGRRFVARCVFVRRVLANLAGVAPGALEFRSGEYGKPRLAFP